MAVVEVVPELPVVRLCVELQDDRGQLLLVLYPTISMTLMWILEHQGQLFLACLKYCENLGKLVAGLELQ